jgi:O-antigen/teichoic acid export membrane protein
MSEPARARATSPLGFVRDIAALFGGGAAAQLVTLGASVIISRLYEPADVGPAAFFLSCVAILSPVGALRFDKAIVLPESAEEARNLALLSLAVGTASALAVGAACVALDLLAMRGETLAALGSWLFFLPIAIWLSIAVHIAAEVRTRDGAFGRLARSRMVGAVTMAGTRIGAALAAGGSPGGFLIGAAAGDLTQLLWLGGRSVFGPRAGSLRATARAFAEFPRYSVPTTFLNRLADQLPVLALTRLFRDDVVGLYAFTQRTLRSPLDTLGQALGGVGLQRAALLWNSGERLAPYFARVTLGLLCIGLPPLLAIAVFGEPIFALLFGEKWRTAGTYAAALVPGMLSGLLMNPSNAVFYVTRRLRAWLALQALSTLARVASFGLAAWWGWDALATLWLFSWTSFAFDVVAIAAAFALSLSTAPASGAAAPTGASRSAGLDG